LGRKVIATINPIISSMTIRGQSFWAKISSAFPEMRIPKKIPKTRRSQYATG
jgi:hypothetical protein